MRNRIIALISCLCAVSVSAQTYYMQGLLRQPDAATARAYLQVTNGGGSGTVTSFSAGNLSPFFNASVANPNTTPALSFSAISQAANLFAASPDGAPGPFSGRKIVVNDIPALPESTITGLTTDLSLRLQSVTNLDSTAVSIIGTSNAPIAGLKALKAGTNVTLVDNGSNVVINASASGTATTTNTADVLSLDKPIGVTRAIQGKQVSVTNGSAYTFVNITNASGYMSDLWMALNTTGDDGSRIAIIVDGVTEYSNRYDQFFGQMFFRQTFAPFFFDNAYLQNRGGQGSYIPIPFTNSLRMQYIPVANDSMWFQGSFHTNVPDTFPNTRHFHTAVGNGSFFTVNQVATLLSITNNPPGRLLGIYFFIDSFHGGGVPASASPATAPLEGRVHIITDGVEAFTSSGTEDYARMAGYFASVTNGYSASPYVSLSAKNVDHWGFMRFHIPDPITFTNALTIQWDAGYSAFVNYTGSVALSYVVYYYTE